MVTEISVCQWQPIHHGVPCSVPLRERFDALERDCLAVHEKAALRVMNASLSEGHQGTAYHPALRHAEDVS